MQLRQHVHLGDALRPAEALLEARERQHAEEPGEADGDEPVLPLREAAAEERALVDLRDDVVDHAHAEDREGAEQRQVRVRDDEVREVRQLVERLERLERTLDVDEEVEEERGHA